MIIMINTISQTHTSFSQRVNKARYKLSHSIRCDHALFHAEASLKQAKKGLVKSELADSFWGSGGFASGLSDFYGLGVDLDEASDILAVVGG